MHGWMVYKERRLTEFLMSLVIISSVTKAEDLDCPYLYTEQLNHFPHCSPYIGGVMELECTAEIPLNATDITIGWFLNCEQLQDDSNDIVLIEGQVDIAEIRRIRSRLTINDITNDFAGTYTCNILGDEEYIPSEPFTLRDSTQLEVHQALGPCVDGDVFGNAVTNEKCAVITESRTIPMSLSCDGPPATSSHDIPVTSTPVVYTTPLNTEINPLSTLLFPLSPTSNIHIHPTPKLPLNPTSTHTKKEMTSPPDALNTITLSLIAVCAVLIIIVIIVSIVAVPLVVMLFRRKQTDDSQSRMQRVTDELHYDYVQDIPVTSVSNPLELNMHPNRAYVGHAPSPADVFHMNINSGYAITGDITTPRVVDAFHMNINSSYGPVGDITTRPVAEDPAGTVG